MVYVVALLIIIFIFPLIITSYIYFDSKLEKVFFAIYIFGFIKIIDGYVTKRDLGGFYIHLKNKAIIVDDVMLNSLKGGQSILKAFHLTSLESYVNLTTNSFYLYYLTILLNFIKNVAFVFLKNNYFLQTPKASVNISTGNYEFQLKARIKILFNLFCITYYFITNSIIKGKGVQNVKPNK